MACDSPCSCCHGACCTGGVCSTGVNCYECEDGGGTWQGAGTTCSPDPCGAVSCTADIGDGTGSTDCAVDECCSSGNCTAGYWVMDVGDCACVDGAIPSGVTIDPAAGVFLDPAEQFGDYAFTTWTLCCQERVASGFPDCSGYPP